jgi:hypothetical protein
MSRLEECNRNLFFLPSKRSLALKDYLRFKQIANQVIESFVTYYNPKINSNLVELSEGNSKCIMEFDTDKIVSSEQLYNCYNSSLLEIYLIKALYRGGHINTSIHFRIL